MQHDDRVQVTINILDKEYPFACLRSETDDLRTAARLIDQRMREIRQKGRIIGTDRIAIMVAIHTAYDYILASRNSAPNEDGTGSLLPFDTSGLESLQAQLDEIVGKPQTDQQYQYNDNSMITTKIESR